MPLRTPIAVTAALLLAGCGGAKQMPPQGPAEVGVVTLRAEPVTMTSELTGRTTATAIAEIRPQVDGIIKARLFTEGSYVRAGQPLYQIDPRLYVASRNQAAAQLASAQASVITANAKVARYRQLGGADAVSKQEIDDAVATARAGEASVRQYAATLDSAKVNLGFTRVYAPISGRIGRSNVTQGALVGTGQATALATIQQLDPIYVDIQQSSDALLALRESLAKGDVLPASTTVQLVLSNGRVYPQTGTIEFGEVSVDPGSGMVTLRARFPNPNNLLLPGMFVRVKAPQAVVRNGILAPQQGITRDAKGNATALVVSRDGKVEQRTVSVAQAIGDKWLVTGGLKAGERLIVEGTDKARPGAEVKAVAAGSK
ncbi:efflux RND transporter periplasmic adaptor subunit [Sphingomonas koreensis]|jgi:membrane fusion protein (multidrug efflux system)|uniref:efflux RND transporter periplasmic adaptor subunit n=1 Tax=Sphingomonas koreensis TaxID=93064 RepID=UPI000835B8E0|nr:efflux RND transporter periplasmic adaptor subunit [Sphingomonas koreensis]PJI87327.1 membrane fusion protein (multidrug efflux system) [Sphingomonas koreensis]RSU57950.1 efflux RND transporter periplasmic adaptor subunit [Sphingomonas koreensis]RSU66185.1 efflux RND transporter periplasmic adaptor subunit [Sphingomonas koreensis]